MQITLINHTDSWDEIAELQADVYGTEFVEETDVLKRKWEVSPNSCLIYRVATGEIAAYLLAHSWSSPKPPKLFEPLPICEQSEQLFLHDLAVSKRLKGLGVGRQMVEQLISLARNAGYKHILLVSVQSSVEFWQKMGFVSLNAPVDVCYGDGAQLMSQQIK